MMEARTANTLARMPSIDGLRGVAVAAVVVYHFVPSWLPGGFLGVDVFFVLSGYLLTSLLVIEVAATQHFSARKFLARRVRRLLPAMLLLLAAIAVYAATFAADIEVERLRRDGIAALFNVANWSFIADDTAYADSLIGASPLRHAWSLSIEEQFYLAFAAGALVAARVASGPAQFRRWVLTAAAACAAASATWMTVLAVGGSRIDRLYFGTDTRAFGMFIGVCLGAALAGRSLRPSWATTGLAVASALVLAAMGAVVQQQDEWMYRGGFVLAAVASAGLIATVPACAPFRHVLSWRPLTALGAISYGVYLWHWPLLVVLTPQRLGVSGSLRLVLLALLTVVVSTASYFVLERPIRTRRIDRFVSAPRLAAACAVGVVFIGATQLASAGDDRSDRASPVSAEPSEPPAGDASTVPATERPPSSIEPSDQSDVVDTLPGVGEGAGEGAGEGVGAAVQVAPETTAAQPSVSTEPLDLVMLGDSVLFTLIGGNLTGLFEWEDWTRADSPFDPAALVVRDVTRPGCSFLDGDPAYVAPNGRLEKVSLERWCGDWRADLGTALSSPTAADAVVVLLTNDLSSHFVDDRLVEFGSADYERLLTSFLDDVHTEASAAGSDVVLLAPARRSGEVADDGAYPEDVYRDVLDSYAATRSDVTVIDLGDVVCPGGDCSAPSDGFDADWRYDGLHFDSNGARWMADWITPKLRATVAG